MQHLAVSCVMAAGKKQTASASRPSPSLCCMGVLRFGLRCCARGHVKAKLGRDMGRTSRRAKSCTASCGKRV